MLKSMIIAFSMYSKIPMPHVKWEEKETNYSLCFFPLIGAVIGLCCLGCFYGMPLLGMGTTVTAVVLTVLPLLIGGGIHMDGFLDTVDAKNSYQPKEKKLAILKDPHMGAFAAVGGMIYLFLVFGFFTEVTKTSILFVALGYVYSRILSGLSVVTFQKAKKDGMAAGEADTAKRQVKSILLVEGLLCGSVFLFLQPLYGMVCIGIGILAFLYYRRMSYRLFGGITGDLAGYFLQICEIGILLGVVFAEKINGLL